MTVPRPTAPGPNPHELRQLSPSVAALGYVSMLTAMSSAMIYGLLPVFLVKVLGISIASVGAIEGLAEAGNSFIKLFSERRATGLDAANLLSSLVIRCRQLLKRYFRLQRLRLQY